MRFLMFLVSIALVILAGELARTHQGMPIPGRLAQAGEATADALRPSIDAEPLPEGVPRPNPARMAELAPVNPAAPAVADVLIPPVPATSDVPPPHAPEKEKLILLTEGAYPPFNYRNDTGTLAGFDIDIAKVLCVRLDMECEIIAKPWDELIPALRRGEGQAIVASMLIPAGARESARPMEGIAFTDRYYSTPGHFASRRPDKENPAARPSLDQSRIAVQAGTSHSAYAARRFADSQIIEYPKFSDAKAALAKGEVDLFFSDRNALLRWVATDGSACCELTGANYADVGYFGPGAGIALRKDEVLLRERLNRALAGIVADGTYARISARYFAQSIY